MNGVRLIETSSKLCRETRYSASVKDNCPMPLTCFASGTCVRLAFTACGVGECERLGAMGLREGAQCTILHNTENMIVRIGESRLGVSREIAEQLFAHQDEA